uniref:Uncharacterized protein n=1 Tax=Anopheles culicifacies TaxID=139723 RepID=A0A182LWG4_9DIPT
MLQRRSAQRPQTYQGQFEDPTDPRAITSETCAYCGEMIYHLLLLWPYNLDRSWTAISGFRDLNVPATGYSILRTEKTARVQFEPWPSSFEDRRRYLLGHRSMFEVK